MSPSKWKDALREGLIDERVIRRLEWDEVEYATNPQLMAALHSMTLESARTAEQRAFVGFKNRGVKWFTAALFNPEMTGPLHPAMRAYFGSRSLIELYFNGDAAGDPSCLMPFTGKGKQTKCRHGHPIGDHCLKTDARDRRRG